MLVSTLLCLNISTLQCPLYTSVSVSTLQYIVLHYTYRVYKTNTCYFLSEIVCCLVVLVGCPHNTFPDIIHLSRNKTFAIYLFTSTSDSLCWRQILIRFPKSACISRQVRSGNTMRTWPLECAVNFPTPEMLHSSRRTDASGGTMSAHFVWKDYTQTLWIR